jgi:hypothetical protein
VKPSEVLDRIFNVVDNLDDECGNIEDIRELLLDCSYLINHFFSIYGDSRI